MPLREGEGGQRCHWLREGWSSPHATPVQLWTQVCEHSVWREGVQAGGIPGGTQRRGGGGWQEKLDWSKQEEVWVLRASSLRTEPVTSNPGAQALPPWECGVLPEARLAAQQETLASRREASKVRGQRPPRPASEAERTKVPSTAASSWGEAREREPLGGGVTMATASPKLSLLPGTRTQRTQRWWADTGRGCPFAGINIIYSLFPLHTDFQPNCETREGGREEADQ